MGLIFSHIINLIFKTKTFCHLFEMHSNRGREGESRVGRWLMGAREGLRGREARRDTERERTREREYEYLIPVDSLSKCLPWSGLG